MLTFEPTTLVLDEGGVISEDVRLFLEEPPKEIKLENKQFVVVCIDWNYYGQKKHSINSITASFIEFDEDRNLDLARLVIGTTKSDMLLPQQKVAVRDWVWEYVKSIDNGNLDIWKRTFSHIKQFIR